MVALLPTRHTRLPPRMRRPLSGLRMIIIPVVAACSGAAVLPAAATAAVESTRYGVEYRTLDVVCAGDDLGDSGASSVTECQSYCSVDPRCKFVVYRGTQCSWSASCDSPTPAGSGTQSFGVANRTIPGSGWFWASADDLDLDGHSRAATSVLASGKMSVATAMATCGRMHSCTSFGLVSSSGPLSTATDIQTYLFDAAQIIDPSFIASGSSTFIYYKNASSPAPQRPYCDIKLRQTLVNAGGQRSTRLPMSWKHCSAGLFAQLTLAGHGVVGPRLNLSQTMIEFSTGTYSGNGTLAVPSDASPVVGQSWSVVVVNLVDATPLQTLPLSVVASVCDTEGPWPASSASVAEPVSVSCWFLNSSWAAGNATRRCVAKYDDQLATWAAADTTKCSSGGWSQTELLFLSNYAATSSDGSAAIIGGHGRPSDPVADYFLWLSYFVGNKIFGLEWNEDLQRCPASDGSVDIPGNAAAPPFRRLQVGAFLQQRKDRPCVAFARSAHVSIQQGSAATIDKTLSVVRFDNGSFSVTARNDTNTSIGVRAEMLPWREWSLLRLTIWDPAEARCYAELAAVCGSHLGSARSCSVCAVEHLAALKAAGCTSETNWANVVSFWCECDRDSPAGKNCCGGNAYPTDAIGHNRQ